MYRNSWLPEVFNDFLNTTNMPKANPTAPAINVLESEKDDIVELAAPGVSRHLFCLMMFRRKVLLHVLQTVYSPLPCLRLRLKSRRLHARLQWAKCSTTP